MGQGDNHDRALERILDQRAEELADQLEETLTQKERLKAQREAQAEASGAIPAQREPVTQTVEPEPGQIKYKRRWRGLGVVIGAGAIIATAGRWLRDHTQTVAATGAGAALVTACAALLVLPEDILDDNIGWPGDPPRVLGPVPLEPTGQPTERPPTPVPEPTATATRDGPSRQSGSDPTPGGPSPESEPASSPIPPGNGRDPTPAPTVAPTAGPPQPPQPTRPPTGAPPTVMPTRTPTSSPSPTLTATQTSNPSPTPTPTPTETPPRCLVYADIPELLELCLLGRI